MTALADDLYRCLVSAITDYAIYMVDRRGRIQTWNAGARILTGYSADEVIGQSFDLLFGRQDRLQQQSDRLLQTASRDGRCEWEGNRERKDGTSFRATCVLNAICDDRGELVGFAEIIRDLTTRPGTEPALMDTERRFSLLVQGVTDYAIFMLDPDGIITNWNTGANRIKGYTANEIVGRSFSQFYTVEDRMAGVPARALREAREKGRFEAEGWRVRKDGSRFWASVIIDAVRDDAGRLLGFAKVTRDLTERRAAERAMEDMQIRLVQSQKLEALGQLTGGIAHDFNNLLQVISSGMSLAEGLARTDARLGRIFSEMGAAVARGTAIIRHLLAFSRRMPITPQTIDVANSVRNALPLITHSLRADIRLELDVKDQLWQASVDVTQFELALVNIALNARDAMPDGGELAISVRNRRLAGEPGGLRGKFVAISLHDSGTGIPSDVVDRIFEPFFTTKPVGVGTGLGLSQVHGFVQQSGGTVTVATKPGQGTDVTLFIPARDDACSGDGAAAQGDGRLAGRPSLNILVADDDETRARLTAGILQQAGHRATWEPSAQAVLERLSAGESFDLVLSAAIMPSGPGGLELARTIRRHWPGLPVMLATGRAERAVALQNEFPMLRKPFSTIELIGMVEALVAARTAS